MRILARNKTLPTTVQRAVVFVVLCESLLTLFCFKFHMCTFVRCHVWKAEIRFIVTLVCWHRLHNSLRLNAMVYSLLSTLSHVMMTFHQTGNTTRQEFLYLSALIYFHSWRCFPSWNFIIVNYFIKLWKLNRKLFPIFNSSTVNFQLCVFLTCALVSPSLVALLVSDWNYKSYQFQCCCCCYYCCSCCNYCLHMVVDVVAYGCWCCCIWLLMLLHMVVDVVAYGCWCCCIWLLMLLHMVVDVVAYGCWCCCVWLLMLLHMVVDVVAYGCWCCCIWLLMLLHMTVESSREVA